MCAESNITTDPDKIRAGVEERGGWPATVKRTQGKEETGILRIDFPGFSGSGSLERITWEDFFRKFEEAGLAFLYQDRTAGGELSRFNKFIRREPAK
jgi:hypothetical protein